MTIFNVDYKNGNNANDGSTWALAWKDITLGATAARIAAGDVIRVAKSPNPTSIGSATWTDGADTLTLASALTKSVVDGGETWTFSTNVTGSSSGTRKVGTLGGYFAFADAFTTGKAAYYALGSSNDFSGYEQISFQIYSGNVIAASTLSIRLCSDVAGVTTVDTIAIPALAEVNKFYTVTVDTSAILGSAIQSVALYADLDPGVISVYVGQIIACKASSSADSLTLSSLIGKSSSATDLERLPIRGIVGTTVSFDSKNTYQNSTQGKYAGTSETVTTYKVEPIQTTPKTSNTQSDFTVNDDGTVGSWITYTGGWNTSSNLQDGLTWFDGQNGEGAGIYCSNGSYVNIENFGFVRHDRIYFTSSIINFNNIAVIGITDEGFSCTSCTINGNNLFMFGSYDFYSNDCSDMFLSTILIYGNDYGISLLSSTVFIVNLISSNSLGSDIYATVGAKAYLKNCKLNSTTEIHAIQPHSIYSNRHDDTDDNHKQWLWTGNSFTQITNRHTASGIAWEMVPFVNDEIDSPHPLKVASTLVKLGFQYTMAVWVKKEHATNVSAKLIILADEIAGVSADVEDVKADDTDWEQLSIQFTPTKTGVVNIWIYTWGTTGTDSIYVDDFSRTK